MKKLRVASVQFEHAAGDKTRNLDRIRDLATSAREAGAELVVFPECCISGYWFLRHLDRAALLELAEPLDGPSPARLLALARDLGIMIGAGYVERDPGDHLYNTYLVAFPDGQLRSHRKIHAFVNPNIESGDQFTVFDTPFGWKMAVLICYDCNIGENVRICALRGADLLLAPHQTGGCRSTNPNTMGLIERSLWLNRLEDPAAIEAELKGNKGRGWLLRWLPSRAHDNGLFLAFSNGVGIDDDEIRTGNATIFDPYGRILAETWAASDAIVIADLDPGLLGQSTGRRWIKTRRPELYGLLTERTGIEQDTRTVRFDAKGI